MAKQHKRWFSEEYDSMKQRDHKKDTSENDLYCDSYIGRLRLDALLNEKIILTDAQLLDGTFFHAIDNPAKLVKRLSRGEDDFPLEIRARSSTLEESLLGFIKNPKNNKLTGFLFSSLEDDEMRKNVQCELRKTKSSLINSWKDIPNYFKNIGVNKTEADRILDSWAKWIEVVDKNKKILIKTWSGAFLLAESFAKEPLDKNVNGLGKETAIWVDNNKSETPRSEILDYLSNQSKLATDIEKKEIKGVENWYNRAYNRAAATQHGCDWFESTTTKPTAAAKSLHKFCDKVADLLAKTHHFKNVSTLEIPPNFIYGLAKMEDALFHGLFVMHNKKEKNMEYLRNWWETGDLEKLKSGLKPFVKQVTGVSNLPYWVRIPLQLGVNTIASTIVAFLIANGPSVPIGAALGSFLDWIVMEESVNYLDINERIVRRIVENLQIQERV